ncbi:ribonuclease E inhibitor RraB [Falsiruegeria mediterranea]
MSQNTASHDFAAQQAETFAVYADLQSKHGLPEVADVDYFFVPTSDEADWRPLADVLSRQDYVCQYIEDDEGEGPYLMATLPEQAVSASSIWIGEEVATQAALEHGFAPDGWGLEA